MLTRGVVMLAALLVLAAPAAATTTLTTSERALLTEVNTARTTRGLRPLRPDRVLMRAARWYSHDLLAGNRFEHGDFSGRMRRFGARAAALGENLAWGVGRHGHAAAVVLRWLNSPPHRENLLRPGFRRIGLGAAVGRFAGHAAATVVTANFAGR